MECTCREPGPKSDLIEIFNPVPGSTKFVRVWYGRKSCPEHGIMVVEKTEPEPEPLFPEEPLTLSGPEEAGDPESNEA